MAASTVTGNTSVVLVSSLGTIVYLSSVVYPGHLVTIQDYAGVASQGTPIVISTAKDIFFADGSISTLLYNPYSYLTASSKTPTTWQILNNVGFLTTLSNAFVEQLTATNAFITLVSSSQEYVSTTTIGRVNVTKGLELTGNVAILGDITVGGVVDLFSTLNVNEDISLSTTLLVNGSAALGSTVQVRDNLTVYGNISTTGDFIVKENLYISSSLYVDQALVPKFLSVQTLTMNTIDVGGGLRTNQGVSVGSNLVVSQGFFAQSTFTVGSTFQIAGMTTMLQNVQIDKTLAAQSFLSYSSGVVTQNVVAESLEARGIVSTGVSLLVKNRLLVEESTLVEKVIVTGSLSTNSLEVIGNANLSSVQIQGNLVVDGTASLFSSLQTSSLSGTTGIVQGFLTVNDHMAVSTFFSTMNNLVIGGSLVIDPFCNLAVKVKGDSYIGGDLLGVSTLEIFGAVSTQSLYVSENLFVDGDISIAGTVRANTVGAPIEISLSTVTLSNTFATSNVASIPLFTSMSNRFNIFPNAILAGEGATEGTTLSYIHANPTANIRDVLQDTNTGISAGDTKLISSLRVSTLYNTAVLSSFVVGAGDYLNPPMDLSGFLLFESPTTSKFQFGSFDVLPTSLSFTNGGFGASYNGDTNTTQPKWVAVGIDSNQANTIQYSLDGSTWSPAQTGGFAILPPPFLYGVGNDVVYMSTTYANAYSPKWIATGRSYSTQPSLQFSPDGINWGPGAGSIFPVTFYGNRLLYFPSPINPNDGGIVLAGGAGGPGNFGIRYTYDGVSWQQASAMFGGEFICRDFTVGANYDLVAVGQNSFNTNYIFKAGACNFTNGWSNLSNIPTVPGTFNTISYGNGFYVLGTSATSGNPLTSIWKSLNLGFWSPISSGGFSRATNRITFDTSVGAFIAVGNDVAGSNVQFSIDGSNWTPIGTAFGTSVSSIAQGALPLPDNRTKYFTVNTETRFETSLSTMTLNASTILASSITAALFEGDASQITEVNKFSARMGVSSILTQYIGVTSTFQYFDSTFTSTFTVASELTLAGNTFLSTINLWIAAGLNSDSNANVLFSKTIDSWSQSSNPTFRYYGAGVVGNGLTYNPKFVATGADSDPLKTIQYSVDGMTWNPIVSGGFTIPDSNGFKTGTTVAYGPFVSTLPLGFTTYSRWLVGGYAEGTASTIFYSDDGSNFYTAIGAGNALSTSIQKLKTGNQFAVGLNSSNSIINSSNGSFWNLGSSMTPFTAFGYGYSPAYLFGWYGFNSNGDLYYSSDNGSNWSFTVNMPGMTDIRDMVYTNTTATDGYWVAIGSNSMYMTSSPTISWSLVGAFLSQGLTQFRSLAYNPVQGRWFAGGEAQASIKTLWTSTDGINWPSITSGGFSTAILSYGVGYSVLKTSSMVLAGGIGAFTPLSETTPQILQVVGAQFPPGPSIYTSTILSQSNTSNVFETTVYGLAFTSSPTQTYPFVAVGDGFIPQKTIARSSNLSEWIPAVTGGFSPAGYGAIYYSTTDTWIAVGDSPASSATIQYSGDAANWFATNFSGALPLGGRAITKFRDTSVYKNRLVAVGKAPYKTGADFMRTIAYSDNGSNWSPAGINQGFQYAAYGIGAGIVASIEGVIAVGTPYTTDPSTILSEEASIQFSWDGISWYTTEGGFNVAGYGVAYGVTPSYGARWVAVGENVTEGTPYEGLFSNYSDIPNQTIKVSIDGVHWSNAYNSFVYAGYGVTYDSNNNVFVAVGKSTSNTFTVLYSGNGSSWYTLQSTTSGFVSQQSFGTAFDVFGQEVSITERTPFLEFPKLTIYERISSLAYQKPSLRLLSTSMIFNETMVVNLSSQVMINTFAPVGSNTVTVLGDIQTSTFIYRGADPSYENNIVSSLIVSSLQFTDLLLGVELTTPSWSYGLVSSTANYIAINQQGTSFYTNINDTLFVKKANFTTNPGVGINTSSPTQVLDVNGTFACSTLSTAIYKQNFIDFMTPGREYILSSNLSIYEGVAPITASGKNTIYSEPSSLTLNSILSFNLSTQRVGCYTTNPQFDFDNQRAGLISTLNTQTVTTRTLFFTLQSL